MRKQIILVVHLFLLALAVSAQQSPNFSHFSFTQMDINPAYAGSRGDISAEYLRKDRFAGFEGAPQVNRASIDGAFRLFGVESGLALGWTQDAIGFSTTDAISLAYAYMMDSWGGKLNIGLAGTYASMNLDGAKWIAQDANTRSYPETGKESAFDMALGAHFLKGPLALGFSVMNLLESDATILGAADEELPAYMQRTIALTGGYRFQLANPIFEIETAAKYQMANLISTVDLNVNVWYNKKIWGGVTYRALAHTIGFLGGLELKENFMLGFAYEYPLTSAHRLGNNAFGGSTELYLGYNFSLSVEKSPERFKSVRFL